MIPASSNPLCLYTSTADNPSDPSGEYVFLACRGEKAREILLVERFGGNHRKRSCQIAHALISAGKDALYSRRDSQ